MANYMLLLTFVCFFIVSENLGRIETIRLFLQKLLQQNTLLAAVGTSQVISNVPAAVVLSGFTDQWHQMLAGVNIGGLGTPIASLASLITIKFYMGSPGSKIAKFLVYFTAANLIALALLLLAYGFIYRCGHSVLINGFPITPTKTSVHNTCVMNTRFL